MMFEVVVGLMMLLLGWRCFKQVSHARPHSGWSPINVRTTLGLLLILSGAALLALALFF